MATHRYRRSVILPHIFFTTMGVSLDIAIAQPTSPLTSFNFEVGQGSQPTSGRLRRR